MVICPVAGFLHGGINHGYEGVKEINADFVKLNDQHVSWRMETLGSIILHEYTHGEKLMASGKIARRRTKDDAYGPLDTRKWLAEGEDTTKVADR